MSIGVSNKPFVHRWFILVAAVFGSSLVHHPARAEPADLQLARLAPEQETPTQLGPLPRPLGFSDIVRYRQIFALQHEAAWSEADQLIAQLEDSMLLGHVLADRYLRPSTYRSSYVELTAWLERYADLPEAPLIYRMAVDQRPAGTKKPKPLVGAGGSSAEQVSNEAGRPRARDLWRKGIAAWRAGMIQDAADAFTRLADNESLDGEDLARAAFWAARADLRARRPQFVARFLRMAARSSDEFYGLLAQKTLDERIDFDWREEQLKESMLDLLIRYPAVQRAIALVHVGETELADREVRRLADRARPELAQALVSLAATLELPSAQVELAPQASRADGRRHDGASYPLPQWQPAGGYRLEPSLVHAVIRAESGFDADARSVKGALGLMQVMPDTARHVARLTKLAYNGEDWLLEPTNNMAMGQAWLQQLAGTPTVGNSLLHLVVAYNAGEGRLAGWLAKDLEDTQADPLLFVESLPIAETRAYAKKVMANLWAYQARSGGSIPSLQALAENRWPEVEPVRAAAPQPKAKPNARAN